MINLYIYFNNLIIELHIYKLIRNFIIHYQLIIKNVYYLLLYLKI